MKPFTGTLTQVASVGNIYCYVGNPTCSTFYDWILKTLEAILHPGFGPPIPALQSITTGQSGNLGEAITFLIGRSERFNTTSHTPALGGALTPFNQSAATGVDITVVYLDPNGVVANDRLFIQEIKTTTQTQLGYSSALIKDYQKLLDTTKPSLSLMSRVSWLKFKLMMEHNFSPALLQRVEDLAQPNAGDCTRIVLLPTLVHDKSCNAIAALTNVMTAIMKEGWPAGCIEAWSISISRLEKSLLHLANRVPFQP